MFALRVQFPHNWPGWHVREFVLQESLDLAVSSPQRDHAIPTTVITTVESEMHSDYCSDSPVFRGYICDADCVKLLSSYSLLPTPTVPTGEKNYRSSSSVAVALKFAMREDLVEDLAQEAAVYFGPLKSLQGKSVPRCFGFYTGTGEEGQQIACLMLEYWGEGLRTPFQMLPVDVRIKILECLGELHKCGVHHGDFAERNVLTQNNDIRLIDFDQVEGHDCDCDTKLDWHAGTRLPDLEKFGCSLLWEIGWDMGLWEDLEEESSGSESSGGFGSSTLGSTSSSESDLGLGLDPKLRRDLSLDDGRQG